MSDPTTELVLFDLDGTLYRSTSILPEAYREGIGQFVEESNKELEVPDEDAILAEVGNPAQEIYRNLFPSLSPEEQETLGLKVLHGLADLIRDGGGQLIEGVPEVLEQLKKRFRMGLVTNARVAYMEAVVETYNLEQYFERLRCIEMVDSNEKATLVRGMLDYFDTDPTRTVVIGDRKSDYDAAMETGTRFIGCRFGYSPEKEFPDDNVIDTFAELLDHPFLNRTVSETE